MIRQAVFLVGGLGTRLGDRTRQTPKPMLEVGGQIFLDYLLDEAARHGFNDILLLSGHHGGQVEARYHKRDWRGARVRVLREPEPLGTGGALRFALPHLAGAFLLSNGDSFFDINLRALVEEGRNADNRMALRVGMIGDRYGRVEVANGLVQGFHAPGVLCEGPINSGIYRLTQRAVEELPTVKSSVEGDLFPALAAAGRLSAYLADGYFIDIGVPDDLARGDAELPGRTRRPAVFFELDGVLNRNLGYVRRPDQVVWIPGAKEAIRLCNDAGYFVFIVTKQAGVAPGHYDEEAARTLHDWMDIELAGLGAHVDAYEYSPNHPEGVIDRYRIECRRHKPSPSMIERLCAAWPVDLANSLVVGDRLSDIEAARAGGVSGSLFSNGRLDKFLATRLQVLGITDC